jgi:thiamine pyrophosphokinase
MKCVIFANGYYGNLQRYQDIVQNADITICADGGANYAYRLGITPSLVIGDMDSIEPETRSQLDANGVKVKKYPVHKDFTDLQLALEAAEEAGADSIVLLGSLGNRLDHTIGNLFSGVDLARKGKNIVHYGPDCMVYLVTGELFLEGSKGDIVSVMTLTDQAVGVSEAGMEYPLNEAFLESSKPYAVSNVMEEEMARISVREGVLAVFHYR